MSKLTQDMKDVWAKEKGFPVNPRAIILVRLDEGYYVGKGKDSSKNLV